VPVIDDHGAAANLQDVEAAGGGFQVGGEGFHSRADDFQFDPKAPGGGDRRQGVLDLETDLTGVSQRNTVQREQQFLLAPFGQDNDMAFDEHGSAPLRAVFDDDGVLAVDGEEADLAFALGSHRDGMRI